MSFKNYDDYNVINYGLEPPETSKSLWDNSINEDDIVASIDFQASLQRLKPIEREIILLCNRGYSVREIEEMINLPRATVQDTKDRAIKKLKEMMNEKDSIHSVFA